MTHQRWPKGDPHPYHVWGVCFKTTVDRNVGTGINSQWVQPENSFSLKAIILHGFNALTSYDRDQNLQGWLRVWKKDLKALAAHSEKLVADEIAARRRTLY